MQLNGQKFRWSKHHEFLKDIDLPGTIPTQPFELALSSYEPADQQKLESHGWRVRPGLEVSQDLDIYRDYIGASRGEFTVAKEQNIRLRSGWFSDRAATYLAAGRPVITQETGFSNHLPTGAGLFGYLHRGGRGRRRGNDQRGLRTAPPRRESNRARLFQPRRRAGQDAARPGLSSGAGVPPAQPPQRSQLPDGTSDETLADKVAGKDAVATASGLPPSLVLTPTGRWPTRLPDETIQTALRLPTPVAERGPASPGRTANFQNSTAPATPQFSGPRSNSASIIIVTHNGLPYTRICLTSLLAHWREGDEILVVDNASTDGTPDFLRDLARKNRFVSIIPNEANRGFAAANNQGLVQAAGRALVLLNNDTILLPGWLDGLLRWLDDPGVGMVGPVTNRSCNEAQIDAPYRTYGELEHFAREHTRAHNDEAGAIPMLALFCMAMRRDVFERVGPLDEQFETGMFEDDDYARRVRQAGLRIVCAEDVFVHHFGQASLGELCLDGAYDRVLESNRARFEKKWNVKWQPHGRRLTPEYRRLRERVRATVTARLPADATVIVVSKGDEELLRFKSPVPPSQLPTLHQGLALPASGGRALRQSLSGKQRGSDRAPGKPAGQGRRFPVNSEAGILVARALRRVQGASGTTLPPRRA